MIPFRITSHEVCGKLLNRAHILDKYEEGRNFICAHHHHHGPEFDFEEGPEGTEHRHPHEVFHQDCCQNPFPACHHH